MHIAFYFEPSARWIAGMVTQVDLFLALASLAADRPRITLVVSRNTPDWHYAELKPLVDDILVTSGASATPAPSQRLARRLLQRGQQWLGADAMTRPTDSASLLADLRAAGADCLFYGAARERGLRGLPCIAWIYDFQHLHLPELFADREIKLRDQLYRSAAEVATLVLLKSEAIRRDFEAFAPDLAGKARVLPWVSHIPPEAYEIDPASLLAAYHLPEKFFYLPNQFWVHKNHARVWEALRLLRERGVRPVVVCTGSVVDQRAPLHVADQFRQISEWDLREQVIYLGVVPRQHLFGLMRQSVRVINPSLFEGYGLTAAESRSLGKRTLLSDLPVLREQAPDDSLFFDPRDAADLAEKLELAWTTGAPGPDLALEAQARQELPRRQTDFGSAFVALARESVERWQQDGTTGP